MVAISHDDIADAHGDPDSASALDLRAANLDAIAVPDIFLDRLGQPWRSHIEVDRTGAEPPPQRAEAAREDHRQNHEDDGQASYPAFPGDPLAECSEAIAQQVKTGIRPRQQPARAAARRLVVFMIPT